MNKVTGSAIAQNGEHLEVSYDEEAIKKVSSILTTNLMLHNDSLSELMTKEQILECFQYALKVVLRQDSGAKPSYEVVPVFLSDITLSLNLLERHTRVVVGELTSQDRPHCYDEFLDIMASLGIPCAKVLKVNSQQHSRVFSMGKRELNGTSTIVGIDGDASLEELVVRALLQVETEEQAKLERIIGAYDQMYLSTDELLRQWGVSVAFGNLSNGNTHSKGSRL